MEQGEQLKAIVVYIRDEGDSGRSTEKWSDSGFNLKVEPTGFVQGFDTGC